MQLQRTGMNVLNGRKEEETQAATEDRYESLKWREGRGDAGSYRGQV